MIDGTIKTRDDLEESDVYTDALIIRVWNNNKATYGWITNKTEKHTFNMIVTDEYLVNEEDKEDKIKYKYSNNQIELYYEKGDKSLFALNYRKELEERYKEMIGHYDLTSWIINNDNIQINDTIKKDTYIDVLANKKVELNIYGYNTGYYLINSTHFYIINNDKNIDYTYDNGEIVLYFDNGKERIIFKKVN